MSYEFLKAGNSVIFNTKTTVIKTSFYGVEVLGVVGADIANTIKDVKSLHLQVKPYIPGIPTSYTDYNYVIVKLANGQKEVVGLPWIVEGSIQLSSKRSYGLILDNVEPEQIDVISQLLTNRGIEIRSFTEIT